MRPLPLAAPYDPHAPLRNPLSRRSTARCTADMARCMAEVCRLHGQELVSEDDLLRAGFTPGEIGRCRAGAVAALARRLRAARRSGAPRPTRRAA